jgi:hypothetical protein
MPEILRVTRLVALAIKDAIEAIPMMVRRFLQVIFPDRVEHVERDSGAIQGANAVRYAARYAPDLARAEDPGDAPDGEFEASFQQDTHLLVGVGVIGDDGPRLEVDDREHDPAPGGGPDLHAPEDLVPRPGSGGEEIAGRVGAGCGLFARS